MLARVSTYRPSADNTGAPTEETINRVLELPGCKGIYYLFGNGQKSMSITLWESQTSLDDSRQAADKIRSETSAEQHLQVLDVEEFEVLTREIKG
ncbi:hypothetical protein [Arthrobacter sp. ISL-72]|uniref:hypothetical protein n=1 Tax=Arthrobacter sp. ISL-72 TaxID=2819114 RepID=UPI001BE57A50|nr:hypothetical protein [Arthrobacter sp. ISL-72]MBT2597473.1 hypothetical protein [Arthrobacter sp. ISL-72]